jgi:hypothetical protein
MVNLPDVPVVVPPAGDRSAPPCPKRVFRSSGARAAKALGNDAKAGITITKPNPGGIKGTGASRTGKGKIHDLVTGGRSMKGMKSYKGGR